MKKILKVGLLSLGVISLILGIIGIFLPLLPTTPFLILTAFLFDKGSPKFHHWILSHPLLGPPIRDWKSNRVISKKNKILATTMLFATSTLLLSRPTVPNIGKGLYVVFMAVLIFFILSQKSNSSKNKLKE